MERGFPGPASRQIHAIWDEDDTTSGSESAARSLASAGPLRQAPRCAFWGAMLLLVTCVTFSVAAWASDSPSFVTIGGAIPVGDAEARQQCRDNGAGFHPDLRLASAASAAVMAISMLNHAAFSLVSPRTAPGARERPSSHGRQTELRAAAAAAGHLCLLGTCKYAFDLLRLVPVLHVRATACGFFIVPTSMANPIADFVAILLAFHLAFAASARANRVAFRVAPLVAAVAWVASFSETATLAERTVTTVAPAASTALVLAVAAALVVHARRDAQSLSQRVPAVAADVSDDLPLLLRPCSAGPHGPRRGAASTAFAAAASRSPPASADADAPGSAIVHATAAGRVQPQRSLALLAAVARLRLRAAGALVLALVAGTLSLSCWIRLRRLPDTGEGDGGDVGWLGIYVARAVLRFSVIPAFGAYTIASVQNEFNWFAQAVRAMETEGRRRAEEKAMLKYVSHELRTPLNSISLAVDEMGETLGDVAAVVSGWGGELPAVLRRELAPPHGAPTRRAPADGMDASLRLAASRAVQGLEARLRTSTRGASATVSAARHGATLIRAVLDDMLRMETMRLEGTELAPGRVLASELVLAVLLRSAPAASARRVPVTCVLLGLDPGDAIAERERHGGGGGGEGGGEDDRTACASGTRSSSSRSSGALGAFFTRRSTHLLATDAPTAALAPAAVERGHRAAPPLRTVGGAARDGPPVATPDTVGRANSAAAAPAVVGSQRAGAGAGAGVERVSPAGPPSRLLPAAAEPAPSGGGSTAETEDMEEALPHWLFSWLWRHRAGFYGREAAQGRGAAPADIAADAALDTTPGRGGLQVDSSVAAPALPPVLGGNAEGAASFVWAVPDLLLALGHPPRRGDSAAAAAAAAASSSRGAPRSSRGTGSGDTLPPPRPRAAHARAPALAEDAGGGAEARVAVPHWRTPDPGRGAPGLPPDSRAPTPGMLSSGGSLPRPASRAGSVAGTIAAAITRLRGGGGGGGGLGERSRAPTGSDLTMGNGWLPPKQTPSSPPSPQSPPSPLPRATEARAALARLDAGRLLHVDAKQVLRVLRALLGNALRFSGAGAHVTAVAGIALRRLPPDGAADAQTAAAARRRRGARGVEGPLVPVLRFAVCDEGRGMDSPQAAALFRPFARLRVGEAERGHMGTGLSLAIARVIVEEHGGSIGGWSAGPGRGSVFWVEVPSLPLPRDAGGGQGTLGGDGAATGPGRVAAGALAAARTDASTLFASSTDTSSEAARRRRQTETTATGGGWSPATPPREPRRGLAGEVAGDGCSGRGAAPPGGGASASAGAGRVRVVHAANRRRPSPPPIARPGSTVGGSAGGSTAADASAAPSSNEATDTTLPSLVADSGGRRRRPGPAQARRANTGPSLAATHAAAPLTAGAQEAGAQEAGTAARRAPGPRVATSPVLKDAGSRPRRAAPPKGGRAGARQSEALPAMPALPALPAVPGGGGGKAPGGAAPPLSPVREGAPTGSGLALLPSLPAATGAASGRSVLIHPSARTCGTGTSPLLAPQGPGNGAGGAWGRAPAEARKDGLPLAAAAVAAAPLSLFPAGGGGRAASGSPPARSAAEKAAHAVLAGRRVLVVDDMRSARMLLARVVSRLGAATVDEAEDGMAAVEAVARGEAEGRPYVAVLCDLEMPRMKGPPAIAEMLRRGFRGVVVGVTGSVVAEDLEAMRAAGAHAVCRKPVHKQRLAAALAVRPDGPQPAPVSLGSGDGSSRSGSSVAVM